MVCFCFCHSWTYPFLFSFWVFTEPFVRKVINQLEWLQNRFLWLFAIIIVGVPSLKWRWRMKWVTGHSSYLKLELAGKIFPFGGPEWNVKFIRSRGKRSESRLIWGAVSRPVRFSAYILKRREEIEVLDVSCAHVENTVSWLDSLCRWSQRECIVKHLLCIASNILISGVCGKDVLILGYAKDCLFSLGKLNFP